MGILFLGRYLFLTFHRTILYHDILTALFLTSLKFALRVGREAATPGFPFLIPVVVTILSVKLTVIKFLFVFGAPEILRQKRNYLSSSNLV